MSTPATDIDAPVYSDWAWSDDTVAAGQSGARAAALAALSTMQSEPTSLVSYQSRGCVLVIGPLDAAWSAALQLPASMRRVVLAEPGEEPLPDGARESEDPVLVRAPLAGLRGHLGEFIAEAKGAGGETIDLAALYVSPKPRFDLVLDLGRTPALAQVRPPLGYFRVGRDTDALRSALAEIPDLVGEFEKPRFFNYDPAICAHGRSGLRGCTRCLDACSTGAIRSLGDLIEVDPYLCQGDGGCTTVCPSGAISYAYPPPRDLLQALKAMLVAYREAGGQAPRVLLHDAEGGHDLLRAHAAQLPGDVLPLQVEEITAAGLDVWLSAMAYGADRVGLLLGTARADHEASTLALQLRIAESLMTGMGHAPGRIGTVDAASLADWCTPEPAQVGHAPPAGFDTHNDKRATLRLALAHLHRTAPAPQAAVALPAGAPFGEVRVDTAACTLCMGCVSVCPSHALTDGGETPRLDFTEDLCLQCGLCERACPEQAITLAPRFVYDFEVRRQPRVLNEEEPFCCVACGEPFATPSVMEKMAQRLQGHPLWADEATRARMQMCGDCRVKDMMRADIAKFRDTGTT
ncbi:4Fe-4S binding protein [Alkalisalibacterium limincola]|uniref:4Fe-4S ferredoxin-type domain-containing protein n=1 Tax=Alkalisalibacterium limincola TaxID=2699169 RepID=A0A5C8KSD2_9GAMM|nr:4Fe-4S binding protein [Alkalisalibacterium limincola]TXK62364.1 hypothetical protein FU658_09055 [Alkalisalibacterium limincola]